MVLVDVNGKSSQYSSCSAVTPSMRNIDSIPFEMAYPEIKSSVYCLRNSRSSLSIGCFVDDLSGSRDRRVILGEGSSNNDREHYSGFCIHLSTC